MSAEEAAARARIRTFFPPITIILVSIPLILNLVPPNGIYGFRTSETMASDAVWYPANQSGGIALVAASIVWLIAAVRAPRRFVTAIGMTAVLLSCALWLALVA